MNDGDDLPVLLQLFGTNSHKEKILFFLRQEIVQIPGFLFHILLQRQVKAAP